MDLFKPADIGGGVWAQFLLANIGGGVWARFLLGRLPKRHQFYCIYVSFLSVLHFQNRINAVPKNPCCFQRVSLPVLTWHCSTGEDNMNVISSTTHPGQPSDSGVIFDGPTCQPVTAGSTIKPAMVSFLPCQFCNRQVCRHKEGSLYFAIVAASCSGTLVLVITP